MNNEELVITGAIRITPVMAELIRQGGNPVELLQMEFKRLVTDMSKEIVQTLYSE